MLSDGYDNTLKYKNNNQIKSLHGKSLKRF